jgi:hypothetical protein
MAAYLIDLGAAAPLLRLLKYVVMRVLKQLVPCGRYLPGASQILVVVFV